MLLVLVLVASGCDHVGFPDRPHVRECDVRRESSCDEAHVLAGSSALVPGTYLSSIDFMGRDRLCLREDGTYTFQVPSCFPSGPQEEGVWEQSGDHVVFVANDRRNMLDCLSVVLLEGQTALHVRGGQGRCRTLDLFETAEEERARGGAGCAVPDGQ